MYDDYKKFGYHIVGTETGHSIATNCIVCGESVPITDYEAHGVCIKVCNKCRKAILYTRQKMEEEHGL